MKVRVIDDAALIADMLVQLLTLEGHQVVATTSHFTRLFEADAWKGIDAAIIDLWLGQAVVTGVDVLRHLKEHHPGVRRIVLSASGEFNDLMNQARALCDCCLDKPAGIDDILEAISG